MIGSTDAGVSPFWFSFLTQVVLSFALSMVLHYLILFIKHKNYYKSIVAVVIVVFIAFVPLFYQEMYLNKLWDGVLSPETELQLIRSQTNCTFTDTCVNVGGSCQDGCVILVNKDLADNAMGAIEFIKNCKEVCDKT